MLYIGFIYDAFLNAISIYVNLLLTKIILHVNSVKIINLEI